MEKKSINEVQEIYELEIDRIIKLIKKEKAKKILLQFPDGMKPYSGAILEELKNKTGKEFFIWLDSCFGACDLPIEAEKLGIDFVVQFGHSSWDYKRKDIKVLK